MTVRWLAVAIFLAVSLTSNSLSGQTRRANLAHGLPPGSLLDVAARQFSTAISSQLSGRMEISVFPDEKLGRSLDTVRMVDDGTLAFALVPTTLVEDRSPTLALQHAPFAFDSLEEAISAQQGPSGDLALTRLSNRGLAGLGYVTTGAYHFWGRRAILDPSALANLGVAISGPPDGRTSLVLRGLSARPLRLSTETIATVAAAEATLSNGEAGRLYQTLPFLTLTYHRPEVFVLIASRAFMQGLNPEEAAAVQRTARQVNVLLSPQRQAAETASLDRLRGRGVEIASLGEDKIRVFRRRFSPGEYNVGSPACDTGYRPCKENNVCVCSKAESCASC